MKKNEIVSELNPAKSFVVPFVFAPLIVLSWFYGGWTIIIAPAFGYGLITILDSLTTENAKIPEPKNNDLSRYKIILWAWPPIQFFLIFGSLIVIFNFSEWSTFEQIGLMLVQGMITGAVGIVFAHELMHQKSSKERFLADSLMGMAVYGHFRTEHILVHHRFVGTKRDAVTARFNESFYRFFIRVLPSCLRSAWRIEVERLVNKQKSPFNIKNPFWTYLMFPVTFLALAFSIGGMWGILLFLIQAFVAILHLEVVNYIEHYGLKRQLQEDGKYEQTRSYHSWNSNKEASNLLLINLQKHSDHHIKPSKQYPLLQAFGDNEAPQLPFGYPLMVVLSLIPALWRKVMNPRVKAWQQTFYPNVKSWNSSLE